MSNPADIQVIGAELFVLPVKTRMPIKFGAEVVTWVNCARVRVTAAGRDGRRTIGWGETPLSAQWAWPGGLSHVLRDQRMREFCGVLARDWVKHRQWGHPMELGVDFQKHRLDALLEEFNRTHMPPPLPSPGVPEEGIRGVPGEGEKGEMPHLAALVCLSAFDLAVHDAYGNHLNRPVYSTYNRNYMSRDLGEYLEPREVFAGKYPEDYLASDPPKSLVAWHLASGRRRVWRRDRDEPSPGIPGDGGRTTGAISQCTH